MQDRFVPGGPSDKRPSEGPHAFTTHAGDGPGDTPDILQQIVKEKKADGDTSRNTGKTSARRPLDILRHIMKEQNRAPDDKGGKKLEKALKVLNREAPRNKNIDGKKKDTATTEELSGDRYVQAKGLRQETGLVREIEIADSGEKVSIRYIWPESRLFFRDFSVASIYDFERRAQDLQTHVDHADTQAVYVSLYQLQQEKGAVDALNRAFEQVTGSSIDQALSTRWSGPALEYARQLIGTSERSSAYAIGHEPVRTEEFSDIAERLHHVLSDTKGFVPEKLFAVLTPLRRNADAIQKVAYDYQETFGGDVVSAIRIQLGTGKAADFGRFLLGEQKLEQKIISLKEAERLAAAFSHQTFEAEEVVPLARATIHDEQWPAGTFFSEEGHAPETTARWRSQVPSNYPYDGCYVLASIRSFSLKEMGFGSEKAVLIGVRSDRRVALELQSDYAPDGDVDTKPVPFKFLYHIASTIQVETNVGNQSQVIIDFAPSPEKVKLWPTDRWQKQFYKGSVKNTSFAEIKEMIQSEARAHPDELPIKYAFPHGRVFFFSVDRNYVFPPHTSQTLKLEDSPIPDFDASRKYYDYSKRAITPFIRHGVNYAIAAAIRQERASGTFDAERFARAMSEFPEQVLAAFPRTFPRLFGSFSRTLNAEQERQFQEHFAWTAQTYGSDRHPDMRYIHELE